MRCTRKRAAATSLCRLIRLVTAVWLAAAAAPAAGQGPPSPKSGHSDREATARTLFEEATAHFDRRELRLALEKYRAAYRLTPRAKILLNVGAVLLELERHAEAANTFDDYLRHPRADPERARAVRETLAELGRGLGTLVVSSSTRGARVTVDGVALGTGPLERVYRVPPGRHTVAIATADGSGRTSQVVVVAAGASRRVGLEAAVARPPPVLRRRSTRRARLALFVRSDVDLTGRGAVLAPGASLRLFSALHVFGNALVGNSSGVELGARWMFGRGAVRPLAVAAVPVFVRDGVRVAGRMALGAAWVQSPRVAMVAELGVAYAPSVPFGYVNTTLVGSLGLEFRL